MWLGKLCSRCSTVCGCCPQCLQAGCFLCPMHLCKVCVHFWVGLWRPTRLDVVPGPWVLVAVMKGHQWDVHSVAIDMSNLSIPQQCPILPPVTLLSILVTVTAVCTVYVGWSLVVNVRHNWYEISTTACFIQFVGWGQPKQQIGPYNLLLPGPSGEPHVPCPKSATAVV